MFLSFLFGALKNQHTELKKEENDDISPAKGTVINPVVKERTQTMKTNNQGDFLMWNLSELEARDLCKHRIDAMERWSRRIIDELFKSTYGDNYFEFEVAAGQPLVKSSTKQQVEGRMKDNPGRFARKVDALVIEDLEYFFCREDLYKALFKSVFEPFFSGLPEVRAVIRRVSAIRNKIAHGNPLSQHELEQGVCYSNDFIGVFNHYYKEIGKEKEYNVPTFLSLSDSFGRSLCREDQSCSWEISDWKKSGNFASQISEMHLRSGESYRLILEVDASFPDEFYTIVWYVNRGLVDPVAKGNGNIIEFKVDDKCVSETLTIYAYLTTKRTWHRFGHIKCDDYFEMHMSEVLPPLEDNILDWVSKE